MVLRGHKIHEKCWSLKRGKIVCLSHRCDLYAQGYDRKINGYFIHIPGYDSDRFRVVKERDWKEEGGIFGRIDYADADTKPIEQLQQVLLDKADIKIAELMGKIGDRFLVVDREAGSVTLSGV